MNKTSLFLGFLICLGTQSVRAGLIYPGTDAWHQTEAINHNYTVALFLASDLTQRVASGTVIDDGKKVLLPQHGLTANGLPVDDFVIGWGTDVYDNPLGFMPLDDVFVFGPPTLGSATDFMVGTLPSRPSGITPIQRMREPVASGMAGYFSGYGDFKETGSSQPGFDDGIRRTGIFDVDGTLGSFEVYSNLFPVGHPSYNPNDMGGMPGDSGGSIVFDDGSGTLLLGAMVNRVTGFDIGRWTIALELDAINHHIDSVPEPASLSLLTIGLLFVLRRRG